MRNDDQHPADTTRGKGEGAPTLPQLAARYRDQQPPSYTPHDPGVSSPDPPGGSGGRGWTCIRDTHQTPDRTTRRSGQGRVHDGRVHGNVTFDVVGAGRDQGGRIERIVEGQHRPRGMPACLGGVKLVVTT